MFAQRALALSADFISATQLNTTQIGTMSPSSVEHLLTQKVRLLARRETPVIDQELENLRQAALGSILPVAGWST
jgi:hypothetical protein